MKIATKMWFANTTAICFQRTRLRCNNACNTNKTASFSEICELWFCDFIMLTLTLNQDNLQIVNVILIIMLLITTSYKITQKCSFYWFGWFQIIWQNNSWNLKTFGTAAVLGAWFLLELFKITSFNPCYQRN